VDEEPAGVGGACETGLLGACAVGVQVCEAGALRCVGPEPGAEVCNGLDDDCDGLVDEEPAGGGEVCGTGLLGACAVGVQVCEAGALRCVGPEPVDEVCNGFDDDCDGEVDEDLAGDCEG